MRPRRDLPRAEYEQRSKHRTLTASCHSTSPSVEEPEAVRDPVVQTGLAEELGNDEVAICEPIMLEYLNGARNTDEYARFDEALRAARLLMTTPEDWQRALSIHRLLAASGPGHQRSVRLVDLIVAAVGERHGYPIAHVDHDYDRIAQLTGQLVRWVAPDPRPT